MNNEELKKKICEIIAPYVSAWGEDERIADALIAAEIGDVKEAEQRALVAEKALQKFAETITCEDCPFFSDCASSEKMEDLIHSNYCFAEYLKQAEKELAEEEKDGNKTD